MRHGKKINHLSRSAAHRRALLTNLAKALILHKRMNTTLAKAKALRKFVEPILTKSQNDTTHSRRVVFSYFQDKVPVKELFNEVAPKIAGRPGGYTRIIRLGSRLGDNAEMCMIELVDYNELFQKDKQPAKTKTRRSKSRNKPQAIVDPEASRSPAHAGVLSTPTYPEASDDKERPIQVADASQSDAQQSESMTELANQGETTKADKDHE